MAKIAFIQNISFEYFGTMYLASVLKKSGHEVEVFLEKKLDKIIRDLLKFNPDIAGFSCTTGVHKWCLETAGGIKEKADTFTIFGGPHPTFFPEIINEEAVDAVCIGEGEYALLELADAIDKKSDVSNIRNLWVKKNGIVTKNELRSLIDILDALPYPDRDLYYKKYPYLNRSQKSFFAGRGCPFKCTFCFEDTYRKMTAGKGRHIRIRGVDNLIEEIAYTKEQYRIKSVYMQDDTLILDKKWIYEFLEKFKKRIGLPFVCLIRADLLDEELAKALKNAGLSGAFFGIETGDESLRNGLLKKGETDEDIFRAAALLKKYRIPFRTYNMLGLPGETLEQAYKTVEMNARIKTDYPWCSLFQPYPRTELGEYARNHGYVEKGADGFDPSFFRRSIIESGHKNEIANLQKLFFYAVKFPWLFPIIKRLVRLPANILFEFAFLAGYAYCYLKSENLALKEVVLVGAREVKGFFFAK